MTYDELLKKYDYMIHYEDSERNPIVLYGVECGPGWLPTISQLLHVLSGLDGNKKLQIFQIKAKFAEFRFYYNSHDFNGNEKIAIDNTINLYTQKINGLCEHCGDLVSKTNDKGWRVKLCDSCLDKLERR